MTTKNVKKAPRKKAAKKKTTKKATPKRAPKAKAAAKAKTPNADAAPKNATPPRPRDPRLPKPGAILRREHQGKVIEITVLDRGFEFDGRVWRSLSAIAREVTGVVWNGYLWLNLQKRAKAPAADKQTGGAE